MFSDGDIAAIIICASAALLVVLMFVGIAWNTDRLPRQFKEIEGNRVRGRRRYRRSLDQ